MEQYVRIFERRMITMSIEALLHDEIETDFTKLMDKEPGSDEHKAIVDELTKLMDRAIELKKVEDDCNEKAAARESERAMKLQQLEDDKKDRLVKNILGAAGIVLPLIVTIWGTKVSLKFEEEGTFTTVMGRGFINKLLPKK
jgi:hypothetical protein